MFPGTASSGSPYDLLRLWTANTTRPWHRFVPFTLVDTLGGEFFTGYREADGVPADTATAYPRMFGHVAFVGTREGGELVGYWLGPDGRAAADSAAGEAEAAGMDSGRAGPGADPDPAA